MRFDLLLAGGEVVDPGGGQQGRLDVAVAQGRIAAVDRAIPRESAREVYDVSGCYVTPGLIDLHTHVYWGATYWGLEPDPVAARSGVTTWLDAGSAGAYNFPGLRRFIIERSQCRIRAFLNISCIGLTAPTYELSNPDYLDVPLARTIIERHRDLIVGVKARVDRNTTRGTGLLGLERARALADQVGLPLMVHIGMGPPELGEILRWLRPGDILTHCFTGHSHRILSEERRLREEVRRLRDQGLILDIGHGSGSFSYEVAEALLAEGVWPDVISSDIHQISVQGPMYDLPTVLSKFLNLGLSLEAVVERATVRAARAVGLTDLGTLRPGRRLISPSSGLEQGAFTFYDVFMAARPGRVRLVNVLTMRDGRVLWRQPEPALQPWAVLPPHQRAVLQPETVAAPGDGQGAARGTP